MNTNRMGLTPEQSANSFTDDDLRSMITGNNTQSNAWRELLAYREASKEPFMYGIVEPDGSAYMDECCVGTSVSSIDFVVYGLNQDLDEGETEYQIIPLYAAPPIQAVTVPDGLTMSRDELNLLRQWFNSMEDTNLAYINKDDRNLQSRIMAYLKQGTTK